MYHRRIDRASDRRYHYSKKSFFTIDLDGIDPTLIPGVGTPELALTQKVHLLHFLRVFQPTCTGCDGVGTSGRFSASPQLQQPNLVWPN